MAGGGNIQRSRYRIPRPLPLRRDDDGGGDGDDAHPHGGDVLRAHPHGDDAHPHGDDALHAHPHGLLRLRDGSLFRQSMLPRWPPD